MAKRSTNSNYNESNKKSSLLMFAVALLGSVCQAEDWPNPANANDISNGSTPKNTVRVIKAD